MNISEIEKCQEEYEKLLKESPLQRTIDGIAKDILEQKNNAMAMEFTRVICDLLRENGVCIHCTETKLSEKITHNSIEEKYGITFDSVDFSEHDKEFTDKIEELEHEAEKYRRAFKAASEEIEELNGKLKIQTVATKYAEEYVNSLKNDLDRSQTIINQIDNILKDLFGATFEICETKEDFDGFKRFLEKNIKVAAISHFLPTEPIKIADTLISTTYTRKKGDMEKALHKAFGNNSDTVTESVSSKSELRQIAEHLLVYCNHNEGE